MPAYNDASFRAQFPEFADPALYPVPLLQMYFNLSMQFITTTGSPCSGFSGSQLQAALNYLTAHLLVIGREQANGSPGANQGGFSVSSSMGDISVSKLAPPVKDAWDFWLYQTPYGQALMALLSALAVGGLSIGGLSERDSFRKVGGVFW